MRVGQEVGRAHEEEEAGVDREQLAEGLLGDVERGADDRSQQRRDRDDREPGDRTSPRASLVKDEGDRVQPVREVVRDHCEEDEHARRGVDAERDPDPQAVDERVDRDRARAERADVAVSARLLGGVAVVQDEQPLGEEEADEPGADERPHAVRVVEDLDRLRQDVEQRDRDDDTARERDRRREVAAQAERRETPPKAASTVTSAKGIAIQVMRSGRRARRRRARDSPRNPWRRCNTAATVRRRARSPRPRRTRRTRGGGDVPGGSGRMRPRPRRRAVESSRSFAAARSSGRPSRARGGLPARAVVHLDDGERAGLAFDRVEHGSRCGVRRTSAGSSSSATAGA